MKINPIDYDHTALAVGSVVKRPHLGCSSSPALKISVNVEGTLFHCFKCGESVFVPSETQSWRDRKQREAEMAAYLTEKNRRGYALPVDFSQSIDSAGLAWLGTGGWTTELIDRYGIGWSDKLQRVIIPLQPEGFIARAVHEDQRPKYWGKSPTGVYWKSQDTTPAAPYLVVEDVLSAGRCGVFVQTEALLGTPKKWLPPRGIDHLWIWTDNDPAGHACRRSVKERCKWLRIAVSDIKTARDPKLLPDNEIKEVLCSNSIVPFCGC